MNFLFLVVLADVPIRLRFNPVPNRRYDYNVLNDFVGSTGGRFGIFTEYDAAFRFEAKSNRFVLHGKLSNAKQTRDGTRSVDTAIAVSELNRTILGATFDSEGRLSGRFETTISPNPERFSSTRPDELATYAFMNFQYPSRPLSVGSKWTATVNGEKYWPSGEMIKTEGGQKISVTYVVTGFSMVKGRTLVSIKGSVHAEIKMYAGPIDEHYVETVKEKDEFTIDSSDGLVVRARLEVKSKHLSETKKVVSFTRR